MSPSLSPLPPSSPSTLTPGLTVLLVGVLAIGTLFFVFGAFYWCSSRNQRIRNFMAKILPEKYLPSFEPPSGPHYEIFNPNQPNVLDEDLLQDDDTLQEDGTKKI
jgi:hypothetical protein